jgi:alpha-L-rhamnosidase
MKVLLDHNPLAPSNAAPADFRATVQTRPAWISPVQPRPAPDVTAYRMQFDLPEDDTIRVHVSADERYLFYVDGQKVGSGPERGSDRIWFYESYDLQLVAGPHTLVALVWQLGKIAPRAQIGLAGGFLLEAEKPYTALLSTKSAGWENKHVDGITFDMPAGAQRMAWFVEPIQTTDSADYPWGIETGAGDGWLPVSVRREDAAFPFGLYADHVLHPALLPAQLAAPRQAGRVRFVSATPLEDPQFIVVDAATALTEEASDWQALLDKGQSMVIPSHTHRQIILDLDEYVCAYPQVQLSGGRGGRLTIGWAEALHVDASGKSKGQRDVVDGRTFIALCRDVVVPDGSVNRQFQPLWWRSGRFIALLIETGEEPVTLERFGLLETRYPLEMESRFGSSDSRLDAITPLALRGLQMCSHETYMDCPYYEQLMYVGDTRLEALTTYAISSDDRLPRKAVMLFERSRLPDGFTQARYPSRDIQVIPPFSLWWIGMVYDYALWRGDRTFITALMPGVRAVLDGFLVHVNAEKLLKAPAGWNFTDWTTEWSLGVPPDGFGGFSGPLNWHLIYTLGLAAQLEAWVGERLSAQRWQRWRTELATAANGFYWDDRRGLYADDRMHTHFSEHTQCLALLSGALTDEQQERTARALLSDSSLTRTTIYFTHYLFETYRLLEQPDALFKRLKLWFELEELGFKTTPEQPEPSRSDCHGWGAHPLFHFYASLLGIRPTAFGFGEVEIRPMPGHLTHLSGEVVHPSGRIAADLYFERNRVRGMISLPDSLHGTFSYAGNTVALKPGAQAIEVQYII